MVVMCSLCSLLSRYCNVEVAAEEKDVCASQLDIKTSSGHGGMGSGGAGRSRLLLAVAVTAENERIARNR